MTQIELLSEACKKGLAIAEQFEESQCPAQMTKEFYEDKLFMEKALNKVK